MFPSFYILFFLHSLSSLYVFQLLLLWKFMFLQFHFSYLAFHFSYFNGATRHNTFRPQWKLLITHAAELTPSICLCLSLSPPSRTYEVHQMAFLWPLRVYWSIHFRLPDPFQFPLFLAFHFEKEIVEKRMKKNTISMAHSSKFLRTYPKFLFFFSVW